MIKLPYWPEALWESEIFGEVAFTVYFTRLISTWEEIPTHLERVLVQAAVAFTQLEQNRMGVDSTQWFCLSNASQLILDCLETEHWTNIPVEDVRSIMGDRATRMLREACLEVELSQTESDTAQTQLNIFCSNGFNLSL